MLRQLCFALALLALPAPALADRVRLLETDRDAAEARVEMVLGAKEEILTSAFIFGDDPFQDRPLAAEMQATMDGHLERAVRIDGRGFPEGADEPYPGISRGKVLKLRLLRLLAPLIRSQI